MQKSWFIAVAVLSFALLATGPLAAAQPPTTTFYLNGVGTGGANLAGVYTSPYTGGLSSGASTSVICDDFADESFVPENWTAYQQSLSSALLSATWGTPDTYLKWQGAPSLTQLQAYEVAAVLAIDILQSAGQVAPGGKSAQQDYSFALWGLFDPNGVGGNDPGSWGQLSAYGDTTDLANAKAYLSQAVSYVSTPGNAAQVLADVQAVTIYTYVPGTTCQGANCSVTPPQEFMTVNMAEPAFPALLGLDLLAVAGLILFVRRRYSVN